MRRSELTKLIQYLREQGVTEYSTSTLTLKLGPVPPKAAVLELKGKEMRSFADLPPGQPMMIPIEPSIMNLTEEELLFWSSSNPQQGFKG